MIARGALACLLMAAFVGALGPAARAEPTWSTYHRDAQRSGNDPEATKPIVPVLAWQSVGLEAPIWSQPLVLGDRVYVASVGDEVYALEASTGKVVWKRSVGTPVPASELPCGDVEPTVGVVGTPVIDLELGSIYVVADRWSAITKEAEHRLVGLSLANGEEVMSRDVDPPGADPKALLQRTALNLDKGNVVFGYGGNDGDCSDYRGAVVAAPENGGTPSFWQYRPAEPVSAGGAIWATGGPAVDEAGNVYTTTGNPDPPAGKEAVTFDYSDSVLKLNPSEDFSADPLSQPMAPLAGFEPPTWQHESNTDEDLGSAAPELLTGGLLFQAGKSATGYLIDESTMKSVYSGPVCSENSGYSGSFGGDAFAGGVIYIPCENGTQALAYSEAGKSFKPLWQGPSDAVGPPIVSAGLVWTVATGGFSGGGTKLYGLDPATGSPRYTETLPSPVIDHFASPSAAGGRLFVASGCSVTAYDVSELSTPPTGSGDSPVGCGAVSEPEEPSETPLKEAKGGPISLGQTTNQASGTSNSGSSSSIPANATKPPVSHGSVRLLRTHLHASRSGHVHIALSCTAPAPCEGTIGLRALFVASGNQGRGHPFSIALAHARFGPVSGGFDLILRLGRRALAHLHRHKNHLSLLITISPHGSPTQQTTATLTEP
jgi:outer membrane protein assembly factor BamB